jgi:hypothetical protein
MLLAVLAQLPQPQTVSDSNFWALMAPALITLVMAVAAYIQARRVAILSQVTAQQATEANAASTHNAHKLEEVRGLFNGRLSELLAQLENARVSISELEAARHNPTPTELAKLSIDARNIVERAAREARDMLEAAAIKARQLDGACPPAAICRFPGTPGHAEAPPAMPASDLGSPHSEGS